LQIKWNKRQLITYLKSFGEFTRINSLGKWF
jgi:hypothetical protein